MVNTVSNPSMFSWMNLKLQKGALVNKNYIRVSIVPENGKGNYCNCQWYTFFELWIFKERITQDKQKIIIEIEKKVTTHAQINKRFSRNWHNGEKEIV